VRDDDEREPVRAVQGAQEIHDVARGRGVEVPRGLVGQDQARAAHQCARDRDPLLLPAGELARQTVGGVGETDRAERVLRTLAVLGGRGIAVDERQLDVLARAGARQQVEALEDEADAHVAQHRALIGGEPAHVPSVEPVLAARRAVEAAQDVEQRRFPGARGAHDGDQLTGAHGERGRRAAPRPRPRRGRARRPW